MIDIFKRFRKKKALEGDLRSQLQDHLSKFNTEHMLQDLSRKFEIEASLRDFWYWYQKDMYSTSEKYKRDVVQDYLKVRGLDTLEDINE